jgi:C4-type Zn-finger protein
MATEILIQEVESEIAVFEAKLRERSPVNCPYCQSSEIELDDWFQNVPPLTNYVIAWTCEQCSKFFVTYLEESELK